MHIHTVIQQHLHKFRHQYLNLVKAFDTESNFSTSHNAILGYYMYELVLVANDIFQEIIIILFSVALLSDRTDLCL